MTIQLAPEAEAALNAMAQSRGVAPDAFLNSFLPRYQEWLQVEQKAVDEAREAMDRGEWIDHDELFDELERRYSAK